MIIHKTREVAERHGITSPRELAARLGVAPGTAYNLWRGNTERVDLPVLDRICREFGVQPGDLLTYQQEQVDEEKKIGAPVFAVA